MAMAASVVAAVLSYLANLDGNWSPSSGYICNYFVIDQLNNASTEVTGLSASRGKHLLLWVSSHYPEWLSCHYPEFRFFKNSHYPEGNN